MKFAHRFLCLFLMHFLFDSASAQSVHLLKNEGTEKIEEYVILPDQGYTFDQITGDTTLQWKTNDTIFPGQQTTFWVKFKVQIPKKYSSIQSNVLVFPFVENTLYYFDYEQEQWIEEKNGVLTVVKKRNTDFFSLIIQPNEVNSFYVKMNLESLQNTSNYLIPSLYLKSDEDFNSKEELIYLAWLSTMVIILIFVLYSTIIFLIGRDKTYLYYLLILLGGGIYTTSYKKLFNLFTNFRFSSFYLNEYGTLFYFDFSALMNRLSIFFLIFGFVQLTRNYLSTRINFPTSDKILKGTMFFYLASLAITTILTFSTSWYIEIEVIRYQNILFILIILQIFYLGIQAYRKSHKPAIYFLLANILPLLIVLGIALYFVINKTQGNGSLLLPHLAVISMAITFALALAGRVYSMKEELQIANLEAEQLQLANDKMVVEKQRVEIENEMIMAEAMIEKNRNENLQTTLETKQRELVSSALLKAQNRQMLEELKKHLDMISKKLHPAKREEHIKAAISIIKNNLTLDSNWDSFKLHFEQVHPNYFTDLLEKHPSLTQNDLKLCAYLHINLSVKEIAALQNIDPDSVRKSKTRLNKKMSGK